ncbi:MAG: ATP-binding protein [Nanoarchaeota archaeon]
MSSQMETGALVLISEADSLKSSNPREAARLYLEASEEYLQLSRRNPVLESRFVNEASALYMKAQSLKNQGFFKNNAKNMVNRMILLPPERTFLDVAGLDDVKDDIRMKIIEPFKHPDIFKYYGKAAGGGILMYGPPGCGKTLLAEAAAGEAGVLFFHVKASDLKSKYVGETEKNIAALFAQAREHAPCIIFFDEIEALGQDRMSTNHIGRGFVSQLLTEMDGVGTKDKQILLLGATNTPWLIDNALLRDGRFGTSLFIPPPDRAARLGILKMQMKNTPLDNIDLGIIADAIDGFSGADIKAVCGSVLDLVIKDYFKTGRKRKIEYRDFAEVLGKRKSSVILWFNRALSYISKHNLEEFYEDVFKYVHGQRNGGRDGSRRRQPLSDR